MTNFEIAMLFLLQMAFILAVIRVVGAAARLIGQPQVVGEMIAGVLIGPSLFGLFWPELQTQLFPRQASVVIYTISQVGLIIYMFLIGVEFNIDLIRDRMRSAVFVSLAGILTPFALGGVVTVIMLRTPGLFASNVTFTEGFLFIGSAMSITAFPMLARIIYERGLAGTSLGTLALAAGSIDDAAAWCLLAVVLSSFSGNAIIAVSAIGGGILYALFVLLVLRRGLKWLEAAAQKQQRLSGSMLGFALMLVMLGAWFTEFVGIYAIFGAFIMGLAMPRGIVSRELEKKLEPLVTNFLLPLFFIYSGLNTELGLIISPSLLGIAFLVIIAAVFGKGVACWAAARISGENNRDAAAIGTLMNARGLMELILLNIGLERGIITPAMFTIMVLMAIVTTLMASPIFEWVYRRKMTSTPLATPGNEVIG